MPNRVSISRKFCWGPTRCRDPQPRCYLPFFDVAFTALALLEALFFFWSLAAESCFLALSLAFGDLSPMFVPALVWGCALDSRRKRALTHRPSMPQRGRSSHPALDESPCDGRG